MDKKLPKSQLKKPLEKIRGYDKKNKRFKFSVSPMKQNGVEFYTLSVPSEVLAETCFVSNRYEDPEEGFQRSLNLKKAKQIADYIDFEGGTIPTSIILSAQPSAETEILTRKSVSFKNTKKAFLVIDGQHRVWGYKLAKKSIRVPVVIYNGLDKAEEARLFIDVNSKQTPVPSALLLDIKKLAKSESGDEQFYGAIFDLFYEKNVSCLKGRLSKAGGVNNKLNRVNFNRAMRQLKSGPLNIQEKPPEELFKILNNYLRAFLNLESMGLGNHIHKSNVFYGLLFIFPEVVRKVLNEFGRDYSYDNFYSVINRCFGSLSERKLKTNLTTVGKIKNLFSRYVEEELEL